MEIVNLPVENASEPLEQAHQPQPGNKKMAPYTGEKSEKKLTFAKDVDFTENRFSQNSYKEILSQPPSELCHKDKLLWLQSRRTAGLWAQCDDCDKWRYLPHVLHQHELPDKWYCSLNPDKKFASCSIPEAPLNIRDQEDLIHSEYSAGSLVWALMGGWPWWPAMVCDCPDAEQYYWLDGFSDIPTHYNVVFFDNAEVTRAWIAPKNLKPYSSNKKFITKNKKYSLRLKAAMAQANEAESMSLAERLDKFSFIIRHKGEIRSPKKVGKEELRKYQRRFKNKYNVEFPIESDSDDDVIITKVVKPVKQNSNLIMLGTPKRLKKAESVINKSSNIDQNMSSAPKSTEESHTDLPSNSLAVQVGSTGPDFDNDSSKTYEPTGATESTMDEIATIARMDTPNSDDFDF